MLGTGGVLRIGLVGTAKYRLLPVYKLHKMPVGVSIGLAVACASSQESSTVRRFFAVAEALADGDVV